RFSFHVSALHRDLPSFPTRRSSDLQLSSFFSMVAVLLACIGIYGLMSYAVVHRTNEIGIRVALGAQRGQVLRLIMRQGLLLAVRSEEHTSELQSLAYLVCRLLLEKK